LVTFRAWTKRLDGFWDASNEGSRKQNESAAQAAITKMIHLVRGSCPRVKQYRSSNNSQLEPRKKKQKLCSSDDEEEDKVGAPIGKKIIQDDDSSSCSIDDDIDDDDDGSSGSLGNDNNCSKGLAKTTTSYRLKELGYGWCLQTVHSLTHLPQLISKYGSPELYDTSCYECGHKFFAKDPASKVQRRQAVFCAQCAASLFEHQLIDLGVRTSSHHSTHAAEDLAMSTSVGDEAYLDTELASAPTYAKGTRYIIRFSGQPSQEHGRAPCWGHAEVDWQTRARAFLEIHPAVLDFLRLRSYLDDNKVVALHCTTEIHCQNVGQLRAHPNFQNGGMWQDWVMTDRLFKRKGRHLTIEIPVSIHAFVTGKLRVTNDHPGLDTETLDGNEILAVVRCCNCPTKAETGNFESSIMNRFSKGYLRNGSPEFDLIPVSELKRRVLVFEDSPTLHELKNDWKDRMEKSFRDEADRAVPWYEGIQPLNYQWQAPSARTTVCEEDCIEKDWVYVVRPYSEFPDIFLPLSLDKEDSPTSSS